MAKPRMAGKLAIKTVLVLSLIGAAGMAIFSLWAPTIYDSLDDLFPDPVHRTTFELRTLSRQILRFDSLRQSLPSTLEDLTVSTGKGAPNAHLDGWHNRMEYAARLEGFAVRSAGEDRQWGTNDDLAIQCGRAANQSIDSAAEAQCSLTLPPQDN